MQQRVSSLTRKGQVTIPVEIRRLLGVVAHDKVVFLVEDDKVRIAPAGSVVARTAGMMKSEQARLAPEEEAAVIEEAMAEEAVR